MLTVRYDQLGVVAGDRVLDMGAGAGRHAFEARRRGAHVVAFDRDIVDLRKAGATLFAMETDEKLPEQGSSSCVNGDALRLPFPDGAFDRVICSEVMEHIPDDRAAAAELIRVLRSGGTIAVTVPSWGPEKVNWAFDSDYHAPASVGGHVRIYRKSAIEARLKDAGVEVTGSHRAHGLHSPYWWLKTAFGVNSEPNVIVKKYHDLLVWDLMKRPAATQIPEKLLAPVIGKSLVVYGRKP
jgi:SAM-dependent methyltransferase